MARGPRGKARRRWHWPTTQRSPPRCSRKPAAGTSSATRTAGRSRSHLRRGHPQLVHSLVLFEPVVFRLLIEDGASQRVMRQVSATADAMGDHLAHGDAMSAAQRFIDSWSGPGAWRSMPAGRQHAAASRIRSVWAQFDALFNQPIDRAALARLRMPMLLLSGERTVESTRRIAQLLRDALPALHHETLPEMGHLGPITHAAQVDRRIVAFLADAAGLKAA